MKKMFLIVLLASIAMNRPNSAPIQSSEPTDFSIYPTNPTDQAKHISIIRHGSLSYFGLSFFDFNFYDTRIFFDKDATGNPLYKRISEHATENPNFGKVILVLHYPKKSYNRQFYILGTYSNKSARKKLLGKMKTLLGYAKNHAIWFPEQNAIIVGANAKTGQQFEQWLKQQKDL